MTSGLSLVPMGAGTRFAAKGGMTRKPFPKATSSPIPVAVCSANELLYAGIDAMVRRNHEMVLCAWLKTPKELAARRGQVLLFDLALGHEELAGCWRQGEPGPIVVLGNPQHSMECIRRVIMAGASGFVCAEDEIERQLPLAIACVSRGGFYLGKALRTDLVQLARSAKGGEERLSGRERQVVDLLGTGLQRLEIAQRLGIGVKTVDTLFMRCRTKLEQRSTQALREYAIARRFDEAGG